MAILKDRQRQIPNGFKFALPEVGYRSQPFASFDTILNQVDNIVRSNPAKARAFGWPTSRTDIAHWIDSFNAGVCLQSGWLDYVNGKDVSPPKHGPPPGKSSALAAGAKSLAEWIGDGGVPVDPSLAESRAAICVKCPLNQPGELSNFFERATSELLRGQIASAAGMKLSTVHDSKLGVCDACFCPMKLKVWTPLKHIIGRMLPDTLLALDANCWITKEQNDHQSQSERNEN